MFRKKGDNNNKSSKTLRSLRSLLLFIYCLSQSRQTHEPMKSPSCRPAALLVLVLLIASVPVIPRFSLSRCVLTRLHACCLGGTSPTGTPGQNGFGIFSNSISPTLSLSFSLRYHSLPLERRVQRAVLARASSRVAACAPAADERRKELETLHSSLSAPSTLSTLCHPSSETSPSFFLPSLAPGDGR